MKICEAVREAGGRAMLVGGSVRDRLLGIESKDLDLEVYSLEPDSLLALLKSIGSVNTVGEHFSVYKLAFYRSTESPSGKRERFEIDVSIPRRESKSGRGHRGFIIEGDPGMTFEEAARRRDFTINAILFDPLTGEIVDPFGGAQDLKRRALRAVAADTFIEDSLRVLRAVQLAARFEMEIEPQAAQLCRSIEMSDLPRERIWGEVEKLLTLAERPSIGLEAALELGVLEKLFPELFALAKRGDAFAHTLRCLDEAAKLTATLPKEKRITVMLAALCHDLGEPDATDRGEAAEGVALSILDRLGVHTLSGYDARSQALALAREHQRPGEFYRDREQIEDGRIRRLAGKADLDLLYRVAKACAAGRGDASTVAEEWFIEKALSLGVEHSAPAPVLMGRHLIEMGIDPGPRMGEILRQIYELQLDGEVSTLEEAIAAARRFM